MTSTVEGNKTINKLVRILDIFIQKNSPMSLSLLSEASGMPRASLYRVLNPLVKEGFLNLSQADKLYAPGRKLYYLGLIAERSQSLNRILPHYLNLLHERLKHTVVVAQLTGGHIVYLQKKEKPEGLKISLRLGVPHPAGYGILGRLILACKPPEEAKALLENNPPAVWLQAPWPGWEAALPLLKTLREQQYSDGKGENDPSTAVVGVPIFDKAGEVNYAIGVLIPYMFYDQTERDRCLALLRKCSEDISRELGYMRAAG
jgi:DNA-binding IclR family transcriptional regulator